MSAIKVERLTKRFGTVTAVDGIGFTVPRGATVGLLGGNGAGKTTTISMLLGILVPDSGRYRSAWARHGARSVRGAGAHELFVALCGAADAPDGCGKPRRLRSSL
ncbi:ATP-binding cassette domain-containing protein [Acidiphilium iwatense]